MQTGENASYAGLDAVLQGMRAGGTRKAIVPACLLTTSRYKTYKEYLDNSSQDSALEYTVTLGGQTNDIDQMERDSLARFILRNFGKGIKPLPHAKDMDADGSFYFITDSSAFAGKKKFPADTTIKINYTGLLLNGLLGRHFPDALAGAEGRHPVHLCPWLHQYRKRTDHPALLSAHV